MKRYLLFALILTATSTYTSETSASDWRDPESLTHLNASPAAQDIIDDAEVKVTSMNRDLRERRIHQLPTGFARTAFNDLQKDGVDEVTVSGVTFKISGDKAAFISNLPWDSNYWSNAIKGMYIANPETDIRFEGSKVIVAYSYVGSIANGRTIYQLPVETTVPEDIRLRNTRNALLQRQQTVKKNKSFALDTSEISSVTNALSEYLNGDATFDLFAEMVTDCQTLYAQSVRLLHALYEQAEHEAQDLGNIVIDSEEENSQEEQDDLKKKRAALAWNVYQYKMMIEDKINGLEALIDKKKSSSAIKDYLNEASRNLKMHHGLAIDGFHTWIKDGTAEEVYAFIFEEYLKS